MTPRPVQDAADRTLKDPDVDQTTARKMIDDAIGRWHKELSSGSGNGIIYRRWQHHQVSGNRFMKEPCWGDHKDQPEGDMLEKLKAIEFGPILETARRLTDSATFMADFSDEVKTVAGRVDDNWQDNNGQTAVGKINALGTASKTYQDSANKLATHLAGLANESRKCIQRLVDYATGQTDQYFKDYLGNDENVDIAHFSEAIDQIDFCLRTGKDFNRDPYNLDVARSSKPGVPIWEAMFGIWYNDVEKGRLDAFCEKYSTNVGTFRRLIKECYDAVDKHMQSMMNASSGLNLQPFAKLDELAKGGGDQPKKPPPEDQPKDKDKEKDKPGQGGPGPGSGGPGPGSGGPGPGSGGPGPGTGSPPPMPPPYPPAPTDGPSDTTDPSDVPGEPIVDPGKGGPATGETVTIDEGGKKISVTSPDSEGHVKVTVDDGTGKPKTYDMDFSQPTTGTPGTGTPGTPGTGTPGQGQQPDGQPVLGADGKPVQTLPDTAGGDPTQTLKPGPDGKIVLEDGNVTITAEHPPGQPDVVKLTVNDGTGEPTTYTLDYSDPANPQVGQAEPANARYETQEGRHAAQVQGFGGSFETDGPRQDVASATPAAFAGAGTAEAAAFGGGNGSAVESDQPSQTTSTQAVGDFGVGTGDAGFGDSPWSTQGDLLSGGDDFNQVAPAAGEAGLAAIPDDGGQPANQNQAASGMGGMPMMGGMGAGGGGGGDTERSGGQWSVTGDLFADENEPARIAGVLDEDVR
ncbi:hypothetical protein LWC34_23595 [Kibdelosporangium philippinense]|uniref:WXG100 family type VII secretion target n=1 Tax=Kibdelosporangium philippinense TaxID=211113 RepID=A0ABS8ZD67_9PSEU|nr:hypothetical protein [Kibdelosporangium philippinense]MCE7005789.1 hypothetical protein [Kibdelosporangium philippinense]